MSKAAFLVVPPGVGNPSNVNDTSNFSLFALEQRCISSLQRTVAFFPDAISPDGTRVVSVTQIRDVATPRPPPLTPAREGTLGSGSGQANFGSGDFGSGAVEFDGGLGEEGYAICCGTDPALAL
jgi:hypothetical protein